MQKENDGRNDFDFLIGTWKVHHRALKQRLNGSKQIGMGKLTPS